MAAKTGVGIIGSGAEACFLLEVLKDCPHAAVTGLAGHAKNGPEAILAKRMEVPLFSDFKAMAMEPGVEALIDVSGNPEVELFLTGSETCRPKLLHPAGAWLLKNLLDRMSGEEERRLAERQALYGAGVLLASAAGAQQTLDLIVDSALTVLDLDAGTVAMYDEEAGVMRIKARSGFPGKTLPMDYEWRPRPRGLTGMILSNPALTVIEDMSSASGFDAGPLMEMGIMSMIATPLKVTGRIVGILYVDGFKPRRFTGSQMSAFALLALQAAAAIDKAMILEKAELMAITDGLTKLHSHRFLTKALERETRRSQRYSVPLALLMVDVDHFRLYNQSHGHTRGNVILTTLADILKRSARDTDVVARWGGEEFAMILTETPRDKAELVAERIRKEVEALYLPGAETQPGGKLTVSLGVASYPEDGDNATDLAAKAERSLYRSKELGRNRVTMYAADWDIGVK